MGGSCNWVAGTARRTVHGRLGEASLPRNLDASALPAAIFDITAPPGILQPMKKASFPTRARRGDGAFTLIELLVVIAIIAILAAMLLPALSSAKQQSIRTYCGSSLHQIGLAMTMYADDYAGFYPESGGLIPWGQSDKQTRQQSWMQQITPYTKSSNVFHCPSDLLSQFSYFNGVRAAYVVVSNFASVDTRQIQFSSAQVLSGDTLWPIGSELDADKDDYSQNCVGGVTNGIPAEGWQVHSGGQNILFTDSHVKWYHAYIPQEMTFRYDSMHGWQ